MRCVVACAVVLVEGLRKCTNLPGFAWAQLDNDSCTVCRRNPFKGAAGRDCRIIFSVVLLCRCFVSHLRLWEMAQAQIGKSCGRFGKCLSSPSHFFSLPSLCVVMNWRGHIQDENRSVRKNVKAFMLSHGININSRSPPCAYSPLLNPFPFSIVSLAWWLFSFFISFLSLAALCLLLDCLNVSVCKSINKRDGERGGSSEFVLTHAYVCVLVCVCAAVPAGRGR